MAVSGGPRGRSERTDGRETKARLVAAATQSLREVGFAGTSAREVARRAGTHQSQVFYYFGTVPDLLLAALDAAMRAPGRLGPWPAMLPSWPNC